MHTIPVQPNVILCGHWDHIPFGDHMCDHFSWRLHTCEQLSQLLHHVTEITHPPDLIMMDMCVTPLDQIQSAAQLISHMCMFKWGKPVHMCAWVPDCYTKQAMISLLESVIHSVIPVNEFKQPGDLIHVVSHMLKGEPFYSQHVQHVVRNSEHLLPSNTLMWCPHMCVNPWNCHYELLKLELPVHMQQVNSLSELLHMLLTQPDTTHRVVLDAPSMLNTPHMSMWEMLNCVQTVHASVTANIAKKLPIYVMVNCDADLTEIRQIMASNLVQGLMPWPDAHTTYEHIRNSVYDQIHNKHHVPVRLQKRLDAKKARTSRRTKRVSLTPREQQIVQLVCDKGHSNKTIAIQLQISESTVKLHLGNILKKMNVRNRTQLALLMKPHT
jgi:DNA-binding NarL/FixJ family response regulator